MHGCGVVSRTVAAMEGGLGLCTRTSSAPSSSSPVFRRHRIVRISQNTHIMWSIKPLYTGILTSPLDGSVSLTFSSSSIWHALFPMPAVKKHHVTLCACMCSAPLHSFSESLMSDLHALHVHAATWSNAVDQTPSLPGYIRDAGVDYGGFFYYSW